jgi:two-component system sensor kinase FixL
MACVRSRAQVVNKPELTKIATPWLLATGAVALSIAIFLVDAISPLGMAVAALYALVVLMAANVCDRRGVLLVSFGCAALTVIAFTIAHGTNYESKSFFRALVSLSAIAIATILALKNKAAEVALRRSEAYLNEAQRLSHTGSFGWNVAREEIVWSEETYRIFGYEPSVKPTLELMLHRTHPDDLSAVKEIVRRAEVNGADWHTEHRLLMPDGSIKFVDVVARGAPDTSGNFEFVGAIMDETAAKQAEQDLNQARANLAHVNRVTTLGEMTASIAHEVAQPIAAIVTNAGAGIRWIAAQPSDLNETKLALTRILKDGNRANEVIARIRALSRKVPARKDPTSINDLILEVVALTRGEAEQSHVSMRTSLAPDLPIISADRIQLQQVILNLIVNAIEAMSSQKGGRRDLLVGSEWDGPSSIVVVVRDTGPGIGAEHLDRIFDGFYTTKAQGIGMGLAICRSIIEAHDGRLWAVPGKEGGATFQFSLPVDAETK